MIEVIHTTCGGVAFHYDGRILSGGILEASHAYLWDGTHPQPHSPLLCSECGENIPNNSFLWVAAEHPIDGVPSAPPLGHLVQLDTPGVGW